MGLNLPYVLTMGTAVIVCWQMLERSQRNLPISSQQKAWIGFGAFSGAMIGAKMPFVLAALLAASDWRTVWDGSIWMGHGKTIMCGIVGGYLGVEIAKAVVGVAVKTGDSFAVPVAIGVAVGRIACFLGGCCYGTICDLPWGVHFHGSGDAPEILRHPTQLYEAIFHGLAAMSLWLLQRHDLLRGQRIKLYLLGYLGYRFASEWIRPEPKYLAGLTAYQWACLALAPVFIALWIHDQRKLRLQPV